MRSTKKGDCIMAEIVQKKNKKHPLMKFQEEKLALGLLGYVIEQIEEQTPKNMDWVDTIERVAGKKWRFTIKKKSGYYPMCIRKYVRETKRMELIGTLCSIEEELTKIWKKGLIYTSL